MNSSKNLKFLIKDFRKIYKKKINSLHEPNFIKKDFKSLNDCLKSSFVSTYGSNTLRFEKEICNYTGSKYAVCTSSGTAALHTSLMLSKIEKNSEVLLPSFNFVASANVVAIVTLFHIYRYYGVFQLTQIFKRIFKFTNKKIYLQ